MNNMSEVGKAASFSFGGFFIGVLVGAVAGGIAALMLAPKSGQETRDMVMNRFNQAKDVVKGTGEDIKKTGQDMRAQVR
jgi:gas vesicle protein